MSKTLYFFRAKFPNLNQPNSVRARKKKKIGLSIPDLKINSFTFLKWMLIVQRELHRENVVYLFTEVVGVLFYDR